MSSINEKTNGRIVVPDWVDEDGDEINLQLCDAIRGSIYLAGDRSQVICRSIDLLDNEHVVLTADGDLTWYLQPDDTYVIDDTPDFGDTEEHVAFIRAIWGSSATFSLTNAISTTNTSRNVRVTCANHGLAVKDSIALVCDNVGGLDFETVHRVTSVIDANTFEFRHDVAATSTATGGGTISLFAHCKSQVALVPHRIVKSDPA